MNDKQFEVLMNKLFKIKEYLKGIFIMSTIGLFLLTTIIIIGDDDKYRLFMEFIFLPMILFILIKGLIFLRNIERRPKKK